MKKILSLLTVLALIVCCVPLTAAAEDKWEGYTAISNYSQLRAIEDNLSGKYYLTADIAFASDGVGGGRSPIGDIEHPFRGVFDGNGHTISGLHDPTIGATHMPEYNGLFGVAEYATIRNVTVANSHFEGNIGGARVGAILGYGFNGCLIENCHAKNCSIRVDISGWKGDYSNALTIAGGVTGSNGYAGARIIRCSSDSRITINVEAGNYFLLLIWLLLLIGTTIAAEMILHKSAKQ